jgi:hypothetical protein
MFMGAIHRDPRESPLPVLYAGSGGFLDMNSFEPVAYPVVFLETVYLY